MFDISVSELVVVGSLGLVLSAGPASLGAKSIPTGKADTLNQLSVVDVNVSAGLSQNDAELGKTVRFWLTIRNLGRQDLSEIRVTQLHLGGARLRRTSWFPSSAASCGALIAAADTASSGTVELPTECSLVSPLLRARESITVWGEFEGLRPADRENVTAVMSWSPSHDGRAEPSSTAVVLGTVTFRSWWENKFYQYKPLLDLVKDLALPFAIAGFAIYMQRRDKRIASKREEEDRKLAQISQTWNLMLPQTHRLATRHYMPLEANAKEARRTLIGYQMALANNDTAKAKDEMHAAFFYVMMLERRIKFMFKAVGGWYFKNRTGEDLVSRCFQKYRDLFFFADKPSREAFSSFLADVDPDEPFGKFLKRLDPSSQSQACKDAFQIFEKWLKSNRYKDALPYLNAFAILLGYEMNRPYEQWYGKPERLRLDEQTKNLVLSFAKAITTEEGMRPFEEEVKDYLRASLQETTP